MTQVAQLMQNGMQTFVDANGVPFDGGLVYMYVPPSTTTFKDTWIDEGEAVLNTNPVELDAAGRCVIYGNGKYRQVLKDALGNTIWDKLTNWVVPEGEVTSYYDLPIYISGKPDVGEEFPVFNSVRSLRLPAGLAGSVFSLAVNPTATMVFTIYKNLVSAGTISFATNGVPTVTFVSNVTFGAGDQFRLVAPSPRDATGANIALTFTFTVL